VFLHVDQRTAPAVAEEIISRCESVGNVTLLARVNTPWACWNLVAVALSGATQAVKAGCDHVVSMTGQDYPLRSSAYIDDFLSDFRDRSFLPVAPIPTPILGPDGGLKRFRHWHQPVRRRKVRIPMSRRPPQGVSLHWNQSQWCLSKRAITVLADVCSTRPDIVRFFRHVWIPDESFVASVAMSVLADEVINENLWYARWVPGAAHPSVLTSADLQALVEASQYGSDVGGPSRIKLFARKFDIGVDSAVLDLIDERVAS
jgi:hypothetical protein